MVYFDASLWNHDALFVYHFAFTFGSFGGGFIGFHESRAVTQARARTLTQEHRDRLERLNQLLHHDLLNNLNVIQGQTELLIEDCEGDAIDRLEAIHGQSQQATELIQNVRVLVQASRDDEQRKSVDLIQTIETEIDHLRDAYPDTTVQSDLPTAVSVLADDLLGSVFENLIRNAIQHNDAAHSVVRVDVDIDSSTDTVITTISDNGPGIPENLRGELFSPSEDGDHGFGLYLVRTLVDRYEGDITIAETGPEGTTVRVELDRA